MVYGVKVLVGGVSYCVCSENSVADFVDPFKDFTYAPQGLGNMSVECPLNWSKINNSWSCCSHYITSVVIHNLATCVYQALRTRALGHRAEYILCKIGQEKGQ